MERELLNNFLFLNDFVFEVVELFSELLLLLFKVVLSLEGKTDLDKLEENLEVGEEIEIFCWVLGLNNLGGNITGITLAVNVDSLGQVLEVILVHPLWLALSDVLTISLVILEDIGTFGVPGSIHFLGKELAHSVQDELVNFISLTVGECVFDLLDVLCVSTLDILVLLFVHGLDECLELDNLGSFLGELSLNLSKLCLELFDSGLRLLELLILDLNKPK